MNFDYTINQAVNKVNYALYAYKSFETVDWRHLSQQPIMQ